MTKLLQAPFPFWGGKSQVADLVWQRFGAVRNYVEPFAGSLAVLLARPTEPGIETVNDLDGYICNAWRAIQHDPEAVARWADQPVMECDLHARHVWLLRFRDELPSCLEGDPDYYDAKIAGWWLWGICSWIGSGWCSGNGPWQVVDGKFVHLGNAGQGVNRQLVHLGNAGRGVNRKLGLVEWMGALSERLRRVRVCCGDWSRVCGPTPTTKQGLTGVFLDPPYGAEVKRTGNLYMEDSEDVAGDVRKWAIAHSDDPLMRIALCGYVREHEMPDDWECVTWKARGGYGSQGNGNGRVNAHRERIWFNRSCLSVNRQRSLFETVANAPLLAWAEQEAEPR